MSDPDHHDHSRDALALIIVQFVSFSALVVAYSVVLHHVRKGSRFHLLTQLIVAMLVCNARGIIFASAEIKLL